MADNRYKNGKIYRLVNSVDNEFYIGSTCTTLAKRLYWHRGDAKKQPNRQVYKHLNEIGFENVSIVLIEECPCDSKMQLLRRERECIELLNPSLNKAIPSQSRQEGKAKYYEMNRDKIREKVKQYYADNTDKVLQYQSKYREEHKDKLKEYFRNHYALKKQQS